MGYATRSNRMGYICQKINSIGIPQWTPNGLIVCSAQDKQSSPFMTDNGNGGVIITWDDRRDLSNRIYAQNISSNGIAKWTKDGIRISNIGDYDFGSQITSDTKNGAIITWTNHYDFTKKTNVYTQLVNGFGNLSAKNQTNLSNTFVNLFPNPTNGLITIKSSAFFSDIYIINQLGEIVYKETYLNSDKKEIDLSKLSKGIYLYKLVSIDNLITNGKIIITD